MEFLINSTKWSTVTVGKLVDEGVLFSPVDGNHGEIHPKNKDFVATGIPFVMASDLREGKVDFSNCNYISFEQAKRLRKGFSINGDVLLSHKATIGRTALLNSNFEFVVLTPQVTYYRVRNSSKLSNVFLKYYFDSRYFQSILLSWAGAGSTRAYLGITKQLDLPIIFPPIEVQKSIAAVLSSLDDKIELLRAQNKTLEEMAQRLFKEWFVDFNFPNEDGKPYKKSGGRMLESEMGEIPEGWRVDQLGSIVDVKGGTTPSTKEPNFWNGEHYWTSPKDLSNCKDIFLRSTEKKITAEGLSQISSGLLPAGTVLLSSRAPIGYLAIADVPVAINQGYIAIMPRDDYDNFFIYLWVKNHLNTIISAANGSTFLEISKSSFKSIEIVRPPVQTLFEFRKITQPIFEKISTNEKENIALSTLSDLLLPKLMNGEVNLF